jgi:hypothetical protein
MSISYQPSDSSVQAVQLKFQTLILKEQDKQIVTDFATTTPDIDVKQNVDTFAGNSPVCLKILAAGGAPAAATSVAVSGSVITPTFAVAPVSGDVIIVHFVISE